MTWAQTWQQLVGATSEAKLSNAGGMIGQHALRTYSLLASMVDEGWSWTTVAYTIVVELFPTFAHVAQSALQDFKRAPSLVSE